MRFRNIYVLVLTFAITAIFLAMIWSFLQALLLAAIGAGLLHPVYRYFRARFGGRDSLASMATILVLLVIIVGPLTAFLGTVVGQAIEVTETAIPWVTEQIGNDENMFLIEKWVTDRVPALEGMMPTRSQLLQGVGDVAQTLGNFLVASVRQPEPIQKVFDPVRQYFPAEAVQVTVVRHVLPDGQVRIQGG